METQVQREAFIKVLSSKKDELIAKIESQKRHNLHLNEKRAAVVFRNQALQKIVEKIRLGTFDKDESLLKKIGILQNDVELVRASNQAELQVVLGKISRLRVINKWMRQQIAYKETEIAHLNMQVQLSKSTRRNLFFEIQNTLKNARGDRSAQINLNIKDFTV